MTITTSTTTIRAGLVGAGYIARWHAGALRALPGVELTAVCDVSQAAVSELAGELGVQPFTSLEALIEAKACDVVHILTPPQTHADLAVQSLAAGLHVVVEKPFARTRAECERINEAARAAGRIAAVGHNFLGLPSYGRLKEAVTTGALGRVSSAQFNWNFPLEPMRSGPFSLWMLRSPSNLLLELAPHLFAFAVDLFGPPGDITLSVGKPIGIPGSGTNYQSWRILARAGQVDLGFQLSLVETMADRTVEVHGSTGIGRFDFGNDTFLIEAGNARDIVIGPLASQLALSRQHLREGLVNVTRQAASLNTRSPYALSFAGALRQIYGAIGGKSQLDPRYSGRSAAAVIGAIEETLRALPPAPEPPSPALPAPATIRRDPSARPLAVVIGGTGFIGRHLTRVLAIGGRDVRVLSRGRSSIFSDLADRVEVVGVSLRDSKALEIAMRGAEAVFHLARSTDTSWEGCLKNDVEPTVAIAEAALAAGVKRFIYTGTIASYDMSRSGSVITEATPFGPMQDRNLYARSKAECEYRLVQLAAARDLPLVIGRPGIVVGHGGPLQHWGIGRWHDAGAVRIWGDGRNILPFVLVDDVCDALIKMVETDGIAGQSFNLVGEPMLSARDYFAAIHEQLGARIEARPSALAGLYAADAAKYVLKRHVLRKPGAARMSLRDWRSRAHLARFDISHTKSVLGWTPEANREAFIRRAITQANLFGF